MKNEQLYAPLIPQLNLIEHPKDSKTGFKVFSKRQNESMFFYGEYAKNINHVVISIRDRGDEKACIPSLSTCKSVLRLVFDDIDTTRYCIDEKDNFDLFSKKQAIEIFNFVYSYLNVIDLIVVHCAAGVSRSPAVAMALKYVMYENDDDLCQKHPCFNRYVYRVMLNTYYGDCYNDIEKQ